MLVNMLYYNELHSEIAHIAIHPPEHMEIVRVRTGGVDKHLHRRYRIFFLAQQLAVVIAGVRIVRR